jgi:hypothetical protein
MGELDRACFPSVGRITRIVMGDYYRAKVVISKMSLIIFSPSNPDIVIRDGFPGNSWYLPVHVVALLYLYCTS